jgi:TldD protein
VSFRFHPMPRMSNTYIEAGEHDPAEVVESTDFGLYARRLGGGSVEPTTGEFTFAVREAYLVERGKITRPVQGATLMGSSIPALRAIDMVANDLAFSPASCGKEGQRAWVSVGQPTLRISSLMVGGTTRQRR